MSGLLVGPIYLPVASFPQKNRQPRLFFALKTDGGVKKLT